MDLTFNMIKRRYVSVTSFPLIHLFTNRSLLKGMVSEKPKYIVSSTRKTIRRWTNLTLKKCTATVMVWNGADPEITFIVGPIGQSLEVSKYKLQEKLFPFFRVANVKGGFKGLGQPLRKITEDNRLLLSITFVSLL